MDYNIVKECLFRHIENILHLNKKRGIDDNNILKLLLKYYLNCNGLDITLPYSMFIDIITIDKIKCKYKLMNKNVLIERCNKIVMFLKEELENIGILCSLEFEDLSNEIKYDNNKYEQITVKLKIKINTVETNIESDVFYVIKNKKNSTYYFASTENNKWIGVYNISGSRKFNNLDELCKIIFNKDFTDIKIKKLTKQIKPIIKNDENFIPSDLDYNLYNWQLDAYNAWVENNYIGVIEAVTGSGKTLVAKYAIHQHLENDYDILVIVPKIELQEQWYRVLSDFEKYGIYKLGGDSKSQEIARCRIFIAVVNTATKKFIEPRNGKGLIIADECHHYGAPKFNEALNPYFSRRMGLTATYQRQDDGVGEYLNPYFNRICYSFNYKQALEENVIAHFKIAYIGINMTELEKNKYDQYEFKYKTAKIILIRGGIRYKTFGEFMREVVILSEGCYDLTDTARVFLKNFSKKRELLANAENKYEILIDKNIQNIIKNSNGTIIFSQRKESAKRSVDKLREFNINANVVQSGMEKFEVKNVLAEFESGDTDVIAAPLLLDEGIDVPSADLAIIIASNRNKRQMIQRMGRVLRKKPDNRKAKIMIIYAIHTSEDPKLGAHEDFMEDIIDVADEIKYFNSENISEIMNYFV